MLKHVPFIRNVILTRLVGKAKAGDKEAFGQLYKETVEPIYRFILLRVRDTSDAEDLTEQVFIHVITHIATYEERGLPFMAWMFRITRNVVIDHWRGSRKKTVPLVDGPHTMVEETTIERLNDEERATQLWAAIRRLPKSDQDVVILRFIEELSYEDIARIVDKKPGAIRVTLHRALGKLRSSLRGTIDA